MDDSNNSQLFTFDSPQNQSSYIKVIGVGGGGNNAVNHMFRKGITGVEFIVTNTDRKALNGSPVPNKLELGHEGLGVGGHPARARKAAEDKADEIRELFAHNTKMVFITAGMGGGTGTGAAPVIARIAKEIELESEDDDETNRILVVAVVTTPFQFEGYRRLQQAEDGVEELRKYVDSILVINNEKLRAYGNLAMSDAFAMANDVLLTAVKGIAEIITLNAYINIDFRDVNTVMENSGTALMGIGEGEGEKRALQAVEEATASVLLNDNDISGAKNVLFYISYSHDHEMTMDEIGLVSDYINQKTGGRNTNVIFGTGFDEELGEKVKITLIATGFEQNDDNFDDKVKKETPSEDNSQIRTTPPNVPDAPTPIPHTPQAPAVENTFSAPQTSPTPPAPQPIETPRPKNIIPLYGDQQTTIDTHRHEEEKDDNFRVYNRTTGLPVTPTPEPEPAPIQTERQQPNPITIQPSSIQSSQYPEMRQRAISQLDLQNMERSERIKAIRNLLSNDVNGAQFIESINPMELMGEKLYETRPSSESDAAKTAINPDGSIKPNPSLYSTCD